MDDKLNRIRRAIELTKEASVPVMLLPSEAELLLSRHDRLAIHLVSVMAVAANNLSYAPSSDKASEQMSIMFAARDYLIEQGLVTREMVE